MDNNSSQTRSNQPDNVDLKRNTTTRSFLAYGLLTSSFLAWGLAAITNSDLPGDKQYVSAISCVSFLCFLLATLLRVGQVWGEKSDATCDNQPFKRGHTITSFIQRQTRILVSFFFGIALLGQGVMVIRALSARGLFSLARERGQVDALDACRSVFRACFDACGGGGGGGAGCHVGCRDGYFGCRERVPGEVFGI
ncbi:hypothetical protein Vi05172_g10111 [Venturia inaequalis]|nr:hypothetical protein Vi05172_g10111 [Venturia inaequalis]